MIFARPPRSPALQPFVESLWVHQGAIDHRFERVLPSGRMQLLVNLEEDQLRQLTDDGHARSSTRGAALQGVRTNATIVDTIDQRSICGVSFAVGGAWAFFDLPASEVTDRVVDLSELWCRDGSTLRERLLQARDPSERLDVLERLLLERGRRSKPRDRAIETACALLGRGASVGLVGERLGLAPRMLIERFRARVGLRPKLFSRIARFQSVLRNIETQVGWPDAAISHGYSDQAHLIREFRQFAGATPTQYRARSVDERNHVPIDERQFSSIPAGCPSADSVHEPTRTRDRSGTSSGDRARR